MVEEKEIKEEIYDEIEESINKIRMLENRIAELQAIYIEKFARFKYGTRVKRYIDENHKEFKICFVGLVSDFTFTHENNKSYVFYYDTHRVKKDGTMSQSHDTYLTKESELEEIKGVD